jgi:ribosome-binding protein aMBF1 (putative translation factor)
MFDMSDAARLGDSTTAQSPASPGERAQRRERLMGTLIARRQALGLSQTEVAARMRTSQSSVARIESGAGDLRLTTVERYAAAVGMELDWQVRSMELR